MATEKQKLVAKLITENHGNISKSMRQAGYSDVTASTPKNLTESKGWKELMEQHLPDDVLAEKHRQLLDKVDEKGEIDTNAVSKALDMAYKLKGKNAPERSVHLNIDVVSDEELELAKQLLEQRRSKTISKQSDGVISEPVGGEVQNQE